MEERFPLRLQELLEGAVCGPEVTEGIRDHLVEFLKPYIADYEVTAQKTHMHEYVQGLISKLARKTGEGIAYFHDHGRQVCKSSSDSQRGTTRRSCGRSRNKWANGSVKRTASSFSIRRRSPKRARNRSAWRGSGAVVWARSRTARSACSWATFRKRNTPWSACDCTFRKTGPTIARDASKRVCRPGRSSARVTNWHWRCSTNSEIRCRIRG